MILVAISIPRKLVAIQFSISIVVATNLKSIAHRDSERSTAAASTQSQSHALPEEHKAQDYCVSHADFFCVKAERYMCIRAGMCMTGPGLEANSSTEPMAVTGLCPYFPHESLWCPGPIISYYRIPLSMSVSELTNFTCNYYNRQGLMCNQCQTGYGPAVYAFSLMCAKCGDNSIGWILYFILTLLPITVFYFIVILFNIRVATPPLTGLVFMCQTFSFIERLYVDIEMKVAITNQMYSGSDERFLTFLIQIVRILCGFWNLDFFRFVVPPFCVSSHLSNMQALFLEYVYVFYPLLLMVITCVCIELHNKNLKPLVAAWKPFHKIFVRLQNSWDPTASLVNSFSTFTLLYTSKLLFVSSYSLYPTKLYYIKPSAHFERDEYKQYLDPSNEVYSKHYWQFVSCSVTFLVVFLFCPIFLLCLYPYKVFQRFLYCTLSSKLQLILCTFIDTFQGHYKDGTNGTRDYRYFSAVQLILLCLIVSCRIELQTYLYATLPAQIIYIVGSLLFAIARPCKRKYANILQCLLMALTALALFTLLPNLSSQRPQTAYNSLLIMLICMLIPHVVFGGFIIYKIGHRVKTRFGISVRIPNCVGLAFGKKEDETMDSFPVDNTDTIRNQFNQQGLLPTESTALLRGVY